VQRKRIQRDSMPRGRGVPTDLLRKLKLPNDREEWGTAGGTVAYPITACASYLQE
jgi:hypothetical protein